MKKTISVIIAVLIALTAVMTISFCAFADETTTESDDDYVVTTDKADKDKADAESKAAAEKASKEAAESKAAEESSSKKAAEDASSSKAAEDSKASKDAASTSDTAEVVTTKQGQTYIDDGTTKATTTKKAAANVSNIPNTGSTVVVPAIAFLALTAGCVAVVKTKKDN